MNTKRKCEDTLFEKNKKSKMNNSNNSSNLCYSSNSNNSGNSHESGDSNELNNSNNFLNDESRILSYEKIIDTVNQYNNNSKFNNLTIGQNSKNTFTHSENSAFTVVKKKI